LKTIKPIIRKSTTMKKLAMLAGLSGILAVSAMAQSGSATVTVSIGAYYAISLPNTVLAASNANPTYTNGYTTASGSLSFLALANTNYFIDYVSSLAGGPALDPFTFAVNVDGNATSPVGPSSGPSANTGDSHTLNVTIGHIGLSSGTAPATTGAVSLTVASS
jgi:hypothetical protein